MKINNHNTKHRVLSICGLMLLCLFTLTGCGGKDYQILHGFHSSDVKFAFDGKLIGSEKKSGKLAMYDLEKHEERIYEDVYSSWSDTLPEERLILYSGTDQKTGICKMDEKDDIVWNRIIFSDSILRIDPSITKIGETYYITSTKIEGNVNQKDLDAENGLYTLECYASKDLKYWEKRSTIISQNYNTEDIEVINDGGNLRVCFEQETRDQQPSVLLTVISKDGGRTWSKKQTMIDNGADNEMASLYCNEDSYVLYYSSDKEEPGKSYTGASAYRAEFDTAFHLIKDEKLNTYNKDDIRLYEVEERKDGLHLVYARHYLTSNDLVYEIVRDSP